MESKDIRDVVRQAYGEIARRRATACCAPETPCCGGTAQTGQPVPESDLGLSCGDPATFSAIRPGDTVLDLGSGAGKDVFLAAKMTGPTGRTIGVDTTPEMIALARRNAQTFSAATGLTNVEFREGTIEDLPIADGSADVVISNCVINLSPDKPRVFREVYRVLRPGGRMVVSDIVLERPLPDHLRTDGLYAACIAGALLRDEYLAAARSAGFEDVEVLSDRAYDASGACCDPVTSGAAASLKGIAASVTLRAVKQGTAGRKE